MKFVVGLWALSSFASAKVGKEAGIWDGVAFIEGVAAKIYQSAKPGQNLTVHATQAAEMAQAIVTHSKECFQKGAADDEQAYRVCTQDFCDKKCGFKNQDCRSFCGSHAASLFVKFGGSPRPVVSPASLLATAHEAAGEEESAMEDLQAAQERMRRLNARIAKRVEKEGGKIGKEKLARLAAINGYTDQIDQHLATVAQFKQMAETKMQSKPTSFLQQAAVHAHSKGPEDELAKEMTHDLEMNFNKIAPFGKEDTAKELQDHAAKTQDTLVDAVENAEVAEIKRAVFRALTRLRAATIKEFDTIARLETQAIDAYNDAHHYRAENPLAHLHEDEAPVETDKLKSFH
jgi:hypothetical protein